MEKLTMASSNESGLEDSLLGEHNDFNDNSVLAVPEFSKPSLKFYWMRREAAASAVHASKDTKWPTIEPRGLISLRDPRTPAQYYANSIKDFEASNTTKKFFCVDADGNPVRSKDKDLPIDPMIRLHVAIYKARPDVYSIVQLHAQNGQAYSSYSEPLKMLGLDSCVFFNDHVVQTEFIGPTPSPAAAKATAELLGTKRGLILANSGILTVGETVGEAVSAFVKFESACAENLRALRDAPRNTEISMAKEIPMVREIPDSEAASAHDYLARPDVLWTHFVGQVGRMSVSYFDDPAPAICGIVFAVFLLALFWLIFVMILINHV